MKTSISRFVRLLALMLAVIAIASCALTACNDKTPESSSTPSNKEGKRANSQYLPALAFGLYCNCIFCYKLFYLYSSEWNGKGRNAGSVRYGNQ